MLLLEVWCSTSRVIPGGNPLAPNALGVADRGKTVVTACSTANRLLFFESATRKVVASVDVHSSPTALSVSADGSKVFVGCGGLLGEVLVIDTSKPRATGSIRSGKSNMGMSLSEDGRTLYVCHRFENTVGVVDVASGQQVDAIEVGREPVASALTKDGRFLLVANFLQQGRADVGYVAPAVNVILCDQTHPQHGATGIRSARD